MISLLHLSDPHFGTERAHVAEALLALSHALRPDACVLSGDVTQRARQSQYAAALDFVERLPAVPRLVLPGNHDIALFNVVERALHPCAGFVRTFGRDVEPVLDTPHLLVVCVNTTRASRHKHGEIDNAQIERVAARVRRAHADQLRVVVTHQPCAVPRADARIDLLRGHARALDAWLGAGVDLVLGGHIHLPGVMPIEGRGRRLWVVLAGTAVSSRVRPDVGNSVNLVRWDPATRALEIERWDFIEAYPGSSPGPVMLAGEGWGCVSRTSLQVGPRAESPAVAEPERMAARRSAPRP